MKQTTKPSYRGKPYDEMTTAELAKATAMYDRPFYAMDRARPQTAREQKEEAEARRGRPKVGEGAERVLISIKRQLLRSVDEYAKAHKLKRSELIAKALTKLINSSNCRRKQRIS